MKLFKRKIKVRKDYKELNVDIMNSWGYNAFWWPKDSKTKMCIFGFLIKKGDVVVTKGKYYVVEDVDTPMDPGDQHFVKLRLLKKQPKSSERKSSWTDGLV